MKIFNYPVQNPKMRKALDTLLNSGYKLETVEVGKLVKDNELFNNNTLDYHTDVWGDHPAGYEFNPAEINNWSYSDMMSAVKNANGKIILENGRHRCRALYNSGYDYIELPVYDDSIKEDLKDDAKEYFGTTWNWKLGLYINTDGTILDGSGEKFGNVNPRYRTIDHREVSVLFDDIDGGDAMLAYMNEGNIRWKPEAPGFEVIKEPTEAQYKKLSELLWNFRDEFCIDISNTWGENICSEWYDSPREAIAALKEYFRTGRLLTEDTRNQLVAKSRGAGAYKDQTRGKNRFERKKYSKVANQVKSYNTIDMNKFFKQDTLEVTIPVTGETDNYDVVIRLDGVCSEIQRNIKSSRKLDYKTVMQAVTKVFNTANVYVKCSCDDFKYRFDHWSIINNYGVNDSAHDPGPGKGIANPNNDKGIGCKHILLTLANANWVMHVTSCIKNYIFYAEEHMQQAFQKVIFPKLYGIPYSAIEEENLAPDDIDLATEKHIIEVINDWAKNRGRFKKGSNKNSVTGTGGKAKPEQKPAEKPEEKKPVEQKTTDNKEKTEEPEEEVKK